jgi:hypothetical protein
MLLRVQLMLALSPRGLVLQRDRTLVRGGLVGVARRRLRVLGIRLPVERCRHPVAGILGSALGAGAPRLRGILVLLGG